MAVETTTAGREFVRKFNNTLCELQLQEGIFRRTEQLMNEWAEEHPNLRGTLLLREVDESYFPEPTFSAETLARPKLQALAVENERLHEFVAFAHGFRREIMPLDTLVHLHEQWLEPKKDEPFALRISLRYAFHAETVIVATTGEAQDAAREFLARMRYLRGW